MFKQKISSFLQGKMAELQSQYGADSKEYLGISRQYCVDSLESEDGVEASEKHYEASLNAQSEQYTLPGLERLYRRTIVVEPTFFCAAHCRYCLRSNYKRHTLNRSQIVDIAKYCGRPENQRLNEILITGGDPLLIPRRLNMLIEALMEHATNIKICRVATRLFTQDPVRFDEQAKAVFRNKPGIRFEIATQINHPAEFFPETLALIDWLKELGVKIYSQNVLLRGVNDDTDTLVRLYDQMRQNDIEAHYLFHCVPLRNTGHLRTTVDEALELANNLSASGFISGRAKPMLATMTDIGKIVLYQNSIIRREGRKVLLQSKYRLEDRLEWNPSWSLPESAEVDEHGFLRVWYLDGTER